MSQHFWWESNLSIFLWLARWVFLLENIFSVECGAGICKIIIWQHMDGYTTHIFKLQLVCTLWTTCFQTRGAKRQNICFVYIYVCVRWCVDGCSPFITERRHGKIHGECMKMRLSWDVGIGLCVYFRRILNVLSHRRARSPRISRIFPFGYNKISPSGLIEIFARNSSIMRN